MAMKKVKAKATKKKKKAPEPEPIEEEEEEEDDLDEDDDEDDEQEDGDEEEEEEETQEEKVEPNTDESQLPEMPTPPTKVDPVQAIVPTRQELIDMGQGYLGRLNQIFEELRSSP